MKRTIAILLALLLALTVLTGCGSTDSENAQQTPAASTEKNYDSDITKQVTEWKSGSADGVDYVYAERVVYCTNPKVASKQCLNIYVPAAYMNTDGTLNESGACGDYTCKTAPILYINSTGAYLGKQPYKISEASETLAGKNGWYYNYLKQGFVLVFSGARGRADYDKNNNDIATGKAPVGLADLKAGIRFVKANAANLPGDVNKIISNGMSAGGAMSTLLAVSGNSHEFDSYLEEMGAVMDQTDDVYAAQIYCPIIDLENADFAYAWMFQNDTSAKAQEMSDFQKAMGANMYEAYIDYFNALALTVDGVSYELGEDGRSGSFYDFLLEQYGASYSVYAAKNNLSAADAAWLTYDAASGTTSVSSLEDVVAYHNNRSKVTPSFDSLGLTSSENGVFGSSTASLPDADFVRHFSVPVTEQIALLQADFPSEYAEYYEAYKHDSDLSEVQEMVRLYNPYTYLNAGDTDMAQHIRVCVGTQDSDTSPSISATLVLKLRSLGIDTEYNMIWGLGHTDADYADAFEAWVNSIS